MAGEGGVEGRKERESEREAGGQERSEGAKRAGGQEQGSARWPPLLPGMDRRMVHGQSAFLFPVDSLEIDREAPYRCQGIERELYIVYYYYDYILLLTTTYYCSSTPNSNLVF